MIGVILAGGHASRFRPATKVTSKHLFPVFDKPAIYYPLATLISSGINEIYIIVKPTDRNAFEALLGCGTQFGVSISYCEQIQPYGVPQAFSIVKKYIGKKPVVLILGDNIFVRPPPLNEPDDADDSIARIFGSYVTSPSSYGIAEVSDSGSILSLVEKPKFSKSNLAITGIYKFPPDVCNFVNMLKPSKRGELEIIDLLKLYNVEERVRVTTLSNEIGWFDTGTPNGLLEAGIFVREIQIQSKTFVGSPELAAVHNGFVSADQMISHLARTSDSLYANAIVRLLKT